MTVVFEGPDPWYHALRNYKRAEGVRSWDLWHVAVAFLRSNGDRLSRWLGGAPDVVTVVPSKKERPRTPEEQKLFRVVQRAVEGAGLPWTVEPLLQFAGTSVPRQAYRPEGFSTLPSAGDSIHGARILLVDDAWVSGATMVSVAGKLEAEGARRVGLLALARVLHGPWWEVQDAAALRSYQAALRTFDPDVWPID